MSRYTGYAIFAHGPYRRTPELVKKHAPHNAESFTIRKVQWYSTGNSSDPDIREIWTDDGQPLWGSFFATEESIYVTKMNAYMALDRQLKELEQHYRDELQRQITRVTPLIEHWNKMVVDNQKNLL